MLPDASTITVAKRVLLLVDEVLVGAEERNLISRRFVAPIAGMLRRQSSDWS